MESPLKNSGSHKSYSSEDDYHRRSRSRSRRRSSRDGRAKQNPSENRCLGVFGLNPKTPEFEIHNLFSRYGKIDNIQLIRDPMTRDSRGFCFVYYFSIGDAKLARNECNGLEVDGRRIRVDYSLTSRPNSPTPGQYRGYPRHRRHRDESRRHHRSRSSSLCRKCRRRSRSRSYGRSRYSSSRSYSRSPKHRRR